MEDPKNFNLFKQRSVYAKAQLSFIEVYLSDFQTIVKKIMENNANVKQKIKEKRENNEII